MISRAVVAERIAALFVAVFLASPLFAHELGMVQVEATFQKDGTYVVDLIVDREHIPPDVTLSDIEKSAVLAFDGKRASPSDTEIANGVNRKPNITRIRLRGRTPSAVSRFTFANAAIEGFFVLALRNEGQEASHNGSRAAKQASPSHSIAPSSH